MGTHLFGSPWESVLLALSVSLMLWFSNTIAHSMSLNCSFKFLNWSDSRLFTSLSRLLDINLKESIKRILYLNFLFSSLTLYEQHIFLLIVRDTANLTLCFPKILDEEMWVITWKVMKYNWHMFRFSEKQVTFVMRRSSELPGKWQWSLTLSSPPSNGFWQIQHSIDFSNFARSPSEKIISLNSDDQDLGASMTFQNSRNHNCKICFQNHKIWINWENEIYWWKQRNLESKMLQSSKDHNSSTKLMIRCWNW